MANSVQPADQTNPEAQLQSMGLPRIEGASQEADPAPAPADGGGQDPAGQGGDASGGLYDLSSVPEEVRPIVEEHLKAIEGNVTKRFQQWKPYEELGINEVDPQQLQQLLEFAQMAQDEEAFADWWRATGERLDLLPGEDPFGADDLVGLDEELTPDKIRDLVTEAVQEAVNPIQQRVEQTDAERQEAEAVAAIQEQLATIRSEHGDDVDTDAILRLAYAYADEDPDNAIDRGLQDYLSLVNKGEAGLFADKANQPPPVEGEGGADHQPEAITNFDDAKAAGLARLKAANNA